MLIELLKSGEFKVGVFTTPIYQKYLLSYDLTNFTITVQFTTAALSTFNGSTQEEKKAAQAIAINSMREKFINECKSTHNIPLQNEDFVTQEISGNDKLIITTAGVHKIFDKLYKDDTDEVFEEALYVIRELLSKDKMRIKEALTIDDEKNAVNCIDDFNTDLDNWNYIYTTSELNKMETLAQAVTTAMSNGIAFLIGVNTKEVPVTHFRKNNEERYAVVMNDAIYQKLTDMYPEDEEESTNQTEQKQATPAPAVAKNNNAPPVQVKRFPSKYQGKGATDSSSKPKPNRPPPPPPAKSSEKSLTATVTQNDGGPAPLLPPGGKDEASKTTNSLATTESISQNSSAIAPPSSVSSSTSNDLNNVVDLPSAKKFLDEHIYQHEAKYIFKTNYLNLIKEVFNKLSSQNGDDIIANLCDLYDYINEKERKEKVNLRENPRYDALFFKANTKHWISTIREIRTAAYEKLIAFANEKFPGQSEQQKSFIQGYRGRKLFAEHLDNSIFNIFHDTKTVQQIDEQISLRTIKFN